jgi:RNA polymerase sigma-70 factor (ECF subfamily)
VAAAAKRGDQGAWTELARRFTGPVHTICRRFVNDAAEAEDASQEIFTRLMKVISKYEEQGRFAPWLFRISVNVCRNFIRSRGRRQVREASVPSPAESVPDPATEIERRESVARLKTIIDGLPTQYSLSMWLKFQQGLSNQEISQVLDLPPSSVRVVLFRALSLVREKALLEGRPQ